MNNQSFVNYFLEVYCMHNFSITGAITSRIVAIMLNFFVEKKKCYPTCTCMLPYDRFFFIIKKLKRRYVFFFFFLKHCQQLQLLCKHWQIYYYSFIPCDCFLREVVMLSAEIISGPEINKTSLIWKNEPDLLHNVTTNHVFQIHWNRIITGLETLKC